MEKKPFAKPSKYGIFSFTTFSFISTLFVILAIFSPGIVLAVEVTLQWDVSDQATGYKLYYGFESRSYDFIIDVGSNTQHTVIDLNYNQTYYFAVTAYNDNGESSFSEELVYEPVPDSGNETMVINGTEADDIFTIHRICLYTSQINATSPSGPICDWGYYYDIEMNGETYSFVDYASHPYTIIVYGYGGNDRAIISGDNDCFIQSETQNSSTTETETEDTLEQAFHMGAEGGVLYTNAGIRSLPMADCSLSEYDTFNSIITFNGFEQTYFYGESSDVASLYDTPGDDFYVTAGTYSYMDGADGTFRLVSGVPTVYGYTINGGTDNAWHYDTDETGEEFCASGSAYSYMSGDGFFNVAVGFPVNYSYSKGDDFAYFYDSPGVDVFVGDTEYSYMSGDGFFTAAYDFGSVIAQSFVGEEDHCYLNDPSKNSCAGFAAEY